MTHVDLPTMHSGASTSQHNSYAHDKGSVLQQHPAMSPPHNCRSCTQPTMHSGRLPAQRPGPLFFNAHNVFPCAQLPRRNLPHSAASQTRATLHLPSQLNEPTDSNM